MYLFYAPTISSDTYSLTQEESKHCIKVLRLSKGDTIHLTDGKGKLILAELVDDSIKSCKVKVLEEQLVEDKSPFKIHIAIAPTKNTSRFEWFVEKATEIGVNQITPIFCTHSERTRLKHERVERIIQVAAKQSVKYVFPILNQGTDFSAFIKGNYSGAKYIAYCGDEEKSELKKVYEKGEDALILIGPEGDFSKDEVEAAKKNDFIPVSLGTSRLRTETAGVVACHTIHIIND